MGKWSGFKKSLPKIPQDPSYQPKVNQAKTKILEKGNDLGYLGVMYAEARAAKENLEAELEDINLAIEALQQIIVGDLESLGLNQYRLDSGGLISIKDDPYSQVENKQAFLSWIEQTGLKDLLSVHYQTMNSLVKERLENGQNPPPGIKVFIKSGLSYRKPR